MQLFGLVEESRPGMVEIELKKSEGQFSHQELQGTWPFLVSASVNGGDQTR